MRWWRRLWERVDRMIAEREARVRLEREAVEAAYKASVDCLATMMRADARQKHYYTHAPEVEQKPRIH